MRQAPHPPNRLALLWIGLPSGAAVATWALVVITHVIHTTPPARQLTYIGVALALTVTAAWRIVNYSTAKARRDAWWDGFAAGDEPLADVVPLHTTTVHEPRMSSPS